MNQIKIDHFLFISHRGPDMVASYHVKMKQVKTKARDRIFKRVKKLLFSTQITFTGHNSYKCKKSKAMQFIYQILREFDNYNFHNPTRIRNDWDRRMNLNLMGGLQSFVNNRLVRPIIILKRYQDL